MKECLSLPVAVCVQSLSTTVLLGELLDCGAHSTAELVACLRTKDAHELDFWGFVTTMTVSGKITNLLPVIDGEGQIVGMVSLGDLAVSASSDSPLAAVSRAAPNV